MINDLINKLLARYINVSYEIRGKARLLFIFNITIIPLVIMLIIILNLSTQRELFSAVNIVLPGFILIVSLSLILLLKGYYNPAANILALTLVIGNSVIVHSTMKYESAPRVLASCIPLIAIVSISLLFCKKRIFAIVFAIAAGVFLYTIPSSGLFKNDELGSSVGAYSITIAIVAMVGYLSIRINEQARKLRSADSEKDRKLQLDINSRLLESLKRVSEKLDSSSGLMSVNSTSLSDNMQTQAATTEEITATVEEISAGLESVNSSVIQQYDSLIELMNNISNLSNINHDMENSINEALGMTTEITGKAKQGERSLMAMSASMQEISTTSNQMTGILGMINDISDKINLLSLNASIEAARAGDAGRGFAVVADEIGKLADQTSHSVKEIGILVKKSDEETKKGTANVHETVKVISEIIDDFGRINEMISLIDINMEKQIRSISVVNIEGGKVKERSDEIKTATEEQKKGAEEIVKSITDVNEISQVNADSAGEISVFSNEIATMSHDIKGMIESMDLDDSQPEIH